MRVGCDKGGIAEAARAVREGEVIIFPTDTVYGMGCDPFNAKAVAAVYSTKRRTPSKPLPVLGYSKEDLMKVVEISPDLQRVASRFWPGPLTILARVKSDALRRSLGLGEKMAVRVPRSPCALSILKECRLLTGTSANLSGFASHTDPESCFKEFSTVPVFVDGGVIRGRGESTIIDVRGGDLDIIREGAVKRRELLEELWD